MAAALVVVVGLGPAARADDLTIPDPGNDVHGGASGQARNEPRADITSLVVHHEASQLTITVTVAQATPIDDPVWQSQLSWSAALFDTTQGDAFRWIWEFTPDGHGGVTGSIVDLNSDTGDACPTAASADATAKTYTLTTGLSCLRSVPRVIKVQSAMIFNPQPNDPSFSDLSADFAPDDGPSDQIASSGSADLSRIAGNDRIATAIALSQDAFGDGGATAAVLASADTFPDAIAGGPLARSKGGPLLLTSSGALDDRVGAELDRVLPPGSDVYLLGGTAALSEGVVSALRQRGFHPQRLAGTNRFETAVAIADAIEPHALVMIADGRGFRDGLIAGAAAATLGGVVVLTDGATLPPATDDYLANDPSRHVAIGIAASAAPGAERITAPDAPTLSQKVLDRLLPHTGMIAIASQGTFADALAGAAHLASLGGGLLLTDGSSLSAATKAALTRRKDEVREVVLYGGTSAISSATEDSIRTTLAS